MKHVWLLTIVGAVFFFVPVSGHPSTYAQQDTSSKKQPDTTKVTPPDSTKKAEENTGKKKPEKPSVEDKIKSSKKIDGLFTLYRDTTTASLQLYLKKEQLD